MGFSGGHRSGSSYQPVAEQWVNWNLNEEGKSSMRTQRVLFEGDIFQSYDTPVAVFRLNNKGEPYALITSANHSLSTNNHLGFARGALIKAKVPYFEVPRLGVSYGWNKESYLPPDVIREVNARYLFDALTAAIENAVRHYRHTWYSWYGDSIARARDTYLAYLKIADATGPAVDDIVTIMDDVEARRKAKYDRYYHPDAVAKRERAKARRIAKKAFGLA